VRCAPFSASACTARRVFSINIDLVHRCMGEMSAGEHFFIRSAFAFTSATTFI
jgi:hypothetical protein